MRGVARSLFNSFATLCRRLMRRFYFCRRALCCMLVAEGAVWTGRHAASIILVPLVGVQSIVRQWQIAQASSIFRFVALSSPTHLVWLRWVIRCRLLWTGHKQKAATPMVATIGSCNFKDKPILRDFLTLIFDCLTSKAYYFAPGRGAKYCDERV